jgi:CopG family nickel-responsive transcriptional regulator
MLCLNGAMAEKLVRFGVAMEAELLRDFDRVVVESRGGTRSEALRDLARAAVIRAQVRRGADAVAALTLVYDHHVRDLTERLTELQHDLGDSVRSTVHVHLDHDHCLEVIVMQGRSDELQSIADRMLALRGVKHGGIELYVGGAEPPPAKRAKGAAHAHAHASGHAHSHDDDAPRAAERREKPVRRAAPRRSRKR